MKPVPTLDFSPVTDTLKNAPNNIAIWASQNHFDIHIGDSVLSLDYLTIGIIFCFVVVFSLIALLIAVKIVREVQNN